MTQAASQSMRVLIVEDESLVGMGLRSQLESLGHVVIGQAASAAQAAELFRAERPNLVLMDIRLDETDGIALAASLLSERRVPVVILSAFSDPSLLGRAADAGVFGYLIKPASTESLAAQIEIAVRRFAEHEIMRLQRDKAEHDLQMRKLIERAKGILMRRGTLSEDEAHRRLQLESQKRRIPLGDLARKIIESDELLGNP